MTLKNFLKESEEAGKSKDYGEKLQDYIEGMTILEEYTNLFMLALHQSKNSEEFFGFEYDDWKPVITSRDKTFASVYTKVYYKEVNEESIFSELNDFVGLRIVVRYLNQVHYLHDNFINSDLNDKINFKHQGFKNYIEEPKSSGYRSLQGIIEVYIPSKSLWIPCELQVRTEIENTWAEREHNLIYKNHKLKDIVLANNLSDRKTFLEMMMAQSMHFLHVVDSQLDAIRDEIDILCKKEDS